MRKKPELDTPKATDEPPPRPGLATRHVFLDTQVYREVGHDLQREPLRTLASYISAKRLVVHTTDITLAEVKRQLGESVTEFASQVRATAQKMQHWRERAPQLVAREPKAVNIEQVTNHLYEEFRARLLFNWSGECHRATAVSAAEIFKAYFEGLPPFDRSNSKEFPDAFAIATLAKWCEAENVKMYVVSRDKGMQAAARREGSLIPMTSLAELLEVAAKEFGPDVTDMAEQFLQDKAILNAIRDKISVGLGNVGITYTGELPDGEAEEARVNGRPELRDHTVISVSPPHLGIMATLAVPLKVEVHYEDISRATWDSEDRILVGTRSATTDIETEAEIDVFVELDMDARRVDRLEITSEDLEVWEPYDYG